MVLAQPSSQVQTEPQRQHISVYSPQSTCKIGQLHSTLINGQVALTEYIFNLYYFHIGQLAKKSLKSTTTTV